MATQSISCTQRDYVPEDITRDIFSRLPVKSLIRFQSLSKDWAKLFKTPDFISEHLHQSHNNPSLLFVTLPLNYSLELDNPINLIRSHEVEIEQVHSPFSHLHIDQVVGSCNGLICMSLKKIFPHKDLLVWNPATREFRRIELPENQTHHFHSHIEGFGFSAIGNDYKIVTLYAKEQQGVYSLRTSMWTESRVENFLYTEFISDPSVFIDGALFWRGCEIEVSSLNRSPCLISFDIDKEVFSKIKLPQSIIHAGLVQLALYNDSIAVMYFTYQDPLVVDVWVKDEKSSTGVCFTKLFNVGPFPISRFFPLAIWREEILICKQRERLSLCNMDSNELKDLPFIFNDYLKSFIYSESLVSIDG